MAHFNFVISRNAKWGYAGFYIDCHRMTVPENILLQKALHFAAAVMRDTNLNAQDCVTCNFNCIVSKLKDFSRSVAHICTEKLVISISKTVPDNIWVVTAVH